ncbi:MAG: PLDc N-terminal domain-containing protein [Methylacidiphilales bacterium]|nr:PLDc N-terminal domain-containing protein [Candidatus Methylacidiphilales bacterium]
MLFFALPYFLENARDIEIIGFVLGIIFWFQMLRHCITRESDPLKKFLWILFMFIAPGFSSLVYFFVRVARVHG